MRPDPAPQPDPTDLTTPVTLAETAQLWWFCDGAIMDVGTREHLHRSWGLCPRHSWLYFRTENELKYQPLGNAVLTEDLVRRAAELLGSHHRPHTKRHRLSPTANCLSCDYLAASPEGRDRFTDDMQAIRRGDRTQSWIVGCGQAWRPHRCPHCPNPAPVATPDTAVAADGHTDAPGGIACRLHLLADPDAHGTHDAVDYLQELCDRLTGCVKSMTVDGPDRTVDTDAALVEGLGWLTGWPPAAGWTVAPGHR